MRNPQETYSLVGKTSTTSNSYKAKENKDHKINSNTTNKKVQM